MTTIAQIGCGYWGPNLLRAFSTQRGCHVKWVAEASPERREYVRANFPRTMPIGDWEQAVRDPEVAAVVIATPAATHFTLARFALEAGKHVFVEKPLATTLREADELGKLAGRTGLALMVGHTFLYNAAVRYLKGLMDRGEVGEVYYVYSQRLNLGQVRSDVNAWWNLAPHDLSILLYLMNNKVPTAVAAHGMAYIQPGIEDVVFATLFWDDRVTAQVHVSWLDPGKVRRVTLVGSRKMVVYDDMNDNKIAVIDKGVDRIPHLGERMDYDAACNPRLNPRTGDIWLPQMDYPEPLKVEAAHFLDCVRTGATPLTGPPHAQDVVAILEAGQESLRHRGSLTPVRPQTGAALAQRLEKNRVVEASGAHQGDRACGLG